MPTDLATAGLEAEIWACLETVTDPELDEPITEMGFVERAEIVDTGRVDVEFRLPTYWCSPNFAFLMAFGIREAVGALPWVRQVEVRLNDHCFGDEVNEGVNSGRPFHDIFAEYCDGARLDEVAQKFRAKAFDRRQEAMLLGLRARGLSDGAIVAMTLDEFDRFAFTDDAAVRQKPRYRDLLLSQSLAEHPGDRAFPAWDGQPLTADALPLHLARLRSTRINMEFNGAMCRGLASTRYKEVRMDEDGPTLVDFILGRVPPREGATARE
ncbi:MAG: metal-sulfur cluster assembly factor [Paracoccus sp. (in: a-proteobacteria)]